MTAIRSSREYYFNNLILLTATTILIMQITLNKQKKRSLPSALGLFMKWHDCCMRYLKQANSINSSRLRVRYNGLTQYIQYVTKATRLARCSQPDTQSLIISVAAESRTVRSVKNSPSSHIALYYRHCTRLITKVLPREK